MTIHTIYPRYSLEQNTWVFDDSARGVQDEPFVAGADVILDLVTAGIPDAWTGFTLRFSDQPFDGHQFTLRWIAGGPVDNLPGNWYHCQELGLTGWLCPVLLRYFDAPPAMIYAEAEALPSRLEEHSVIAVRRSSDEGAHVAYGDGVTDDTEAIQASIDGEQVVWPDFDAPPDRLKEHVFIVPWSWLEDEA